MQNFLFPHLGSAFNSLIQLITLSNAAIFFTFKCNPIFQEARLGWESSAWILRSQCQLWCGKKTCTSTAEGERSISHVWPPREERGGEVRVMQPGTWADMHSTKGRDKDFIPDTEQYGPQRDTRKLTKCKIALSGDRNSGWREERENLKGKGKKKKGR